jgi:hypothetical protein
MRERVCTFGSHAGLAGVLCDPERQGGGLGPAVLLFNAGLDHHVGPHRLNVELARDLAARGVASLRFDLSGLGDSEARRDLRGDDERAVLDVTEAMDFLEQSRGANRFVVVALCSGVDPAHAVAVRDDRVGAAVLIDGYAYVTRGWWWRDRADRARRVLRPASYPRWLRRHLWPWLGRRGRPEVGAAPIFDRTFPPPARFRDDLDRMLARGVRLLFLYTRHAYFFNHRRQFAVMIGERRLPDGIDVEHWRGLDHVLTPVRERERAVRRLSEWIAATVDGGLDVTAEGSEPSTGAALAGGHPAAAR